jgi:hypothetical protein
MSLDFTPLANAINQLEKSLQYATSEAAQADLGLFEHFGTRLFNALCSPMN